MLRTAPTNNHRHTLRPTTQRTAKREQQERDHEDRPPPKDIREVPREREERRARERVRRADPHELLAVEVVHYRGQGRRHGALLR